MGKQVNFKKPGVKSEAKAEDANGWVSNRDGNKRLTIDVPMSLHSQLKIEAIKQGITMASLVKQAIVRMLGDQNS